MRVVPERPLKGPAIPPRVVEQGYSISTPLGTVRSPKPGPIYLTIIATAAGVFLALVLGYLHHRHMIDAAPQVVVAAGNEAEDILTAARTPADALSRSANEKSHDDASGHAKPAVSKSHASTAHLPAMRIGVSWAWKLLAHFVTGVAAAG